ncbi:DNA phosphorothioation-dependent restriction protein DptG [Lactiplantibacillus paraplantarum]|uniref:DNA phosphorothioation-dependent restriction protein DptG n=1 Tax=Lactiplantibacillus paraplantarum TaxID=60520 RepID=UPI0038521615|nr:DNA phosphorothioation-dependent restriction protein DptG [Lactiplantibacillus plantarum]
MNNLVSELCSVLNFQKKLKYKHDISTSLLPFYTRNPERVKFTEGFGSVVGVIARKLNGESMEITQKPFELGSTSLETIVDTEIVVKLFDQSNYQQMQSAKLLQYQPLATDQQSKGEIRLGLFLIQLLKLQDNQDFVDAFKAEKPVNLYEKILYESLADSNENTPEASIAFTFYDNEWFSGCFSSDIKHFLTNKDYFYQHIDELLEFYYFTYVIQLISRISDTTEHQTIIPLYFTLENEPVSQSRLSIQQGYQLVYQHGQDLLIDMDVLNYLNALIPDNCFYWKSQILDENFKYRMELLVNLKQFIEAYREQFPVTKLADIDFNYNSLSSQINILRLILEKHKGATDSRYAKSLEEISQQGYLRQHGRLGRVFSLSNQTILMLTAAIVGSHKMLLKDVFNALQQRGIYFDRLTREQVVRLFERVNVLEKLSDSGDAQYVKGIL